MALAQAHFYADLIGAVDSSGRLAGEHGAAVHLAELRPCGLSYYVESAFAMLPDTLLPGLALYLGPRYSVALCGASGIPELSADIADGPGRLRVGLDGRFVPPWSNGNEISAFGVPPAAEYGLPTSAEAAVAVAVAATRARVDRVPLAVANSPSGSLGFYPSQCMRWHLHLDHEVQLRRASGGPAYVGQDVYVSRLPVCASGVITLQVPRLEQRAVGLSLAEPLAFEAAGP